MSVWPLRKPVFHIIIGALLDLHLDLRVLCLEAFRCRAANRCIPS